MRQIMLTFDVEDFTNEHSIISLDYLLSEMKKNDLKGLFFITGHMAENLQHYPQIINLLNDHEIGYHSTSHSVHPTIYEFTDIADYKEAFEISLTRESSHIDPLKGDIVRKGGIHSLFNLFPKKKIASFRAPGCCWSPPHLQALQTLGIEYDFSSSLSVDPICYEGLTFYPYPILAEWHGTFSDIQIFLLSLLRKNVTVIGLHPNLFMNQYEWDLIYRHRNPNLIKPPPLRELNEIKHLLSRLRIFLREINRLSKIGLVKVDPTPRRSNKQLMVMKESIMKEYQRSMRWAFAQGYKPKFLVSHFQRFFGVSNSLKRDVLV